MSKNAIVSALSCMILTIFLTVTPAFSAEYQHSLDIEKMNFSWTVDGDKLAVKLSAPTDSWVAVGFNPTNKMKDADMIIGYVKKGKVTIKDEYGVSASNHKSDTKIGGTDNVTVVGGSEEGGVTTIEFSIPLNSGDDKDTVIDPNADTVTIFAYGTGRDSFRIKHNFAATETINLGSGEKK